MDKSEGPIHLDGNVAAIDLGAFAHRLNQSNDQVNQFGFFPVKTFNKNAIKLEWRLPTWNFQKLLLEMLKSVNGYDYVHDYPLGNILRESKTGENKKFLEEFLTELYRLIHEIQGLVANSSNTLLHELIEKKMSELQVSIPEQT